MLIPAKVCCTMAPVSLKNEPGGIGCFETRGRRDQLGTGSAPRAGRRGVKHEVEEDEAQRIIHMYTVEEQSLAHISDVTGLPRWTVSNALTDRGVQLRPRGGRKRDSSGLPGVGGHHVVGRGGTSTPERGGPRLIRRSTDIERGATAEQPTQSASRRTERRVPQSPPVFKDETAQQLSERLAGMVDIAKQYQQESNTLVTDLTELWERVERLADEEAALAGALSKIRALKNELQGAKARIAQLESENYRRAIAVSSEGSLNGR